MENAFNTLKAAELSIAERKAGLSIATLEDPNYPKTDLLIALAWVLHKRENPTVTFEAFGMAHTLQEITDMLGLTEEEVEEAPVKKGKK